MPDERGTHNITAFIVDARSPGFSVGKNERKMGLNGVPDASIFLDNVRVPVENRIGEEGDGFKICMRILDLNRPTVGAVSVGLAQGSARRRDLLREGAAPVRSSDRRVPGHPVHARRHGDAG